MSISDRRVTLCKTSRRNLFCNVRALLRRLALASGGHGRLPLVLVSSRPCVTGHNIEVGTGSIRRYNSVRQCIEVLTEGGLGCVVLSSRRALSVDRLSDVATCTGRFFIARVIRGRLIRGPRLIIFGVGTSTDGRTEIVCRFKSGQIGNSGRVILLSYRSGPLATGVVLSSFTRSM